MTRGLKQAWRWRRAYWIRESPGMLAGCAFLALPLLFFLPLEKSTFFEERTRGVGILIWLFAIALAVAIRGSQSLRNETSIWTFQKGLSLGETALEDWILDMGLLAAASLWWALLGFAAIPGVGLQSVNAALGFFFLSFGTAFVTHCLTLFLSAMGIRRPSDLAVAFAMLSLLVPALTLEAAQLIVAGVDLVLPPFHAAIVLSGAIRIHDLNGATAALLHILIYTGFLLGLGLWRVSLWRPRA